MKLCDKVLRLIENFKSKGITSTDNGHSHKYNVNDKDNGRTDNSDNHFHMIKNFQVQKQSGHIHTLEEV